MAEARLDPDNPSVRSFARDLPSTRRRPQRSITNGQAAEQAVTENTSVEHEVLLPVAPDQNLAGVHKSNAAKPISCYDCVHAVHGMHACSRKHKLICTVFGCEARNPCKHYARVDVED